MELENLTKVRRLAVLAVFMNLALTLAAAWALPKELHVVLPILGLMLPLLSLGVIAAAAERRSGAQPTPRAEQRGFTSLRHVTADGGA